MVRVMDASQNLLMTVLFPTHFPRGKWKSAAAEGVRSLIMSLDAMLNVAASRRVPPKRAGTGLLQSGRP